ncbi:MAG: PAS domain S-box protein [Thermomicrobiales bacterium]
MSVPENNLQQGNGRVTAALGASAQGVLPFDSRADLIAAILAMAANGTGANCAFLARSAGDFEWHVEATHNEPIGSTFVPGAVFRMQDHSSFQQEIVVEGATIGQSLVIMLCDATGSRQGLLGVVAPSHGAFPATATDALSRIGRVLSSHLDVQRQAMALRESDERHRTIVDATAEGIMLRLADGRIGAVNRSAEELLGVAADRIIGSVSLPIRHVVVDDDGRTLDDATPPGLQTLRTGKPLSNVLIGIDRPDGTSIWVSTNARPLIAPGALTPYAAVVSFIDVTERLQAVSALRDSEERFKSLSAASPVGILDTDADGRVLYVNPRCEEIVGSPSVELLGRLLTEIFRPAGESEWRSDWQSIAVGAGSVEQELLIRRPPGDDQWINLCVAPLGGAHESVPGFVCTVEDIDSRKRAETESYERQIRLTILNSIATEISAGMSVDQIIDRAVQRLAEHLPHRRVIYGAIDVRRRLKVIRSIQPPGMRSLVGQQRDLAAIPGFFQALRTGCIAVDDVERDQRVAAAADRILAGGARAFLDVLLRIGDEDVALLGLDAAEAHHWTSHEIATLSDVAGYLAVALSHARNDEERHRAALEVRRTAERFQSLVQHSSDIISIFDQHTNRIYISPSVERILGYTAAEMLPKSQATITHPDDLPAIKQAFARMRDSPGEPITTQYRLRHQDGSWRWMESVATNLLDDAAVHGFVSNTRDITERRLAEDALRESEQRFRHAFEHALAGMALTDRDGHFAWVNESLCRMLGYSNDELLASTFHAILHPDELDAARGDSAQLFSGERHAYQRERRFLHKDGHGVWGLLSASVLFDVDGRPFQIIGQVQDVTERRRAAAALEEANAQLEQLNQAKSDFVSLVSHEFRTPLTGIRGFSELIRDEDLPVAEMKEFAADINADAQRLGRLIDQLLDLDRMQSGRIQLLRSHVDLNEVVRYVVQQFRAASDRHQLQLELEESVPTLLGDHDKLIQVVTNLIGNAIKYSPDGGVVRIGSLVAQGSIHLWVGDEGVGIPTGDLERIFDRYARVEGGASRFIKGIGLGLPIARQIVELHGGRIWAESSLDEGSTFHVVIPIPGSLKD